ncbi:hypothetical protein HZ989_12785 [Brevundimonas sp. AJA228-03]|uniref:hypothetical protein n=1 Tax=Brevundimonas sp. AJA228-03 TaxID=2752515 RepID=UPI001AE0BEC8|nr:hypothetical protein [Brevundimonas sp. AJA228-03]QTN19090.1 hypothetical protein HZ989_12785 [Brevundimonas sp. AJA228-03]
MAFARELDYFAGHDELIIDFGKEHFFAPYGMLLLASKLKHFRLRNADLNISFRNYQGHHYPAHMGFFRMFGVDHGREVGEAWGSENYLPITKMVRDDFYEVAHDKFRELPDLIQRHADKIALMIARDQTENRDLFDVLSYSVREVMRNVFEHSEANELYYCAQYWPKSNKVEFALADFGVGIRRGLGENPNFRFKSDKEAIEYSLLPGVSGKTHLPRTSEVWFNSGYGLYMTSRLARTGGNFVIASGQMAIHLSRKTKNNYQTSFPGTALRFNMDVGQIGNVKARLDEFRKEGGEIAKTISGSGNRPPSAMSLLLRRDYSR